MAAMKESLRSSKELEPCTPAPSLFTNNCRTHLITLCERQQSVHPHVALHVFLQSCPCLSVDRHCFQCPAFWKVYPLEDWSFMYYLLLQIPAMQIWIWRLLEQRFLSEQTDASGKADWGVFKQSTFSFPSTVRPGGHFLLLWVGLHKILGGGYPCAHTHVLSINGSFAIGGT